MAGTPDLFNTGVTDSAGAVGSLFSAVGSFEAADMSKASAAMYSQAAAEEGQDISLQELTDNVKNTQALRQTTMALGTVQSDIAGTGSANSGSALDILRDSAMQGQLQRSTVGLQNQVNINDMTEKVNEYQTEASNAEKTASSQTLAGFGGLFSGAIKGAGAAAAFLPLLSA